MILHNSVFCPPRLQQVFQCGWPDMRSCLMAFSSHRKWDTQHLGSKNKPFYYLLWVDKCTKYIHVLCLDISTYKKPFPQPRGPKKSSVGRQTFLHTPLRLGHDQGKDAASFSTTMHDEEYCSDVQYQNIKIYFPWRQRNVQIWVARTCRDIKSRLTIKQQDDQERQHNHAITRHSCVGYRRSTMRTWPGLLVFWSEGRSEDNMRQHTGHWVLYYGIINILKRTCFSLISFRERKSLCPTRDMSVVMRQEPNIPKQLPV